MKKCAFIDRDGTLIFEPQDTYQIDSLDKLRILPGAVVGLRALQDAGYILIMVSNQDGLGTKTLPMADFEAPQQKMLDIFRESRITFSQIFVCPHFAEDNCACRKPKTGLLDEFLATTKLNTSSFVCGDRESDRLLAKNIGVRFLPMETNGNFYEAIKPILEVT
jgi:imidazoleglycerol-phosphate dehydratase/histidinol-phosphatase